MNDHINETNTQSAFNIGLSMSNSPSAVPRDANLSLRRVQLPQHLHLDPRQPASRPERPPHPTPIRHVNHSSHFCNDLRHHRVRTMLTNREAVGRFDRGYMLGSGGVRRLQLLG